MYDYIRGTVAAVHDTHITLDNHGIGYRVYATQMDKARIAEGEEVTFQISYVMREDGIWLYGFLEQETLAVFELLKTVSNIGPKNAMTILSNCSVADLCEAVQTEDTQLLTQIPGVGKKTAGRLILELADKLEPFAFIKVAKKVAKPETENMLIASDALQNLGFVRKEVEEVLLQMDLGQMTIEDIIKESIRKLS